jgi:Uma2 family endonuclease
LGDLLEALGGVAPARVRLRPLPATAQDVVRLQLATGRTHELVDDVLVEKPAGEAVSSAAEAVRAFLDIWNRQAGDAGLIPGVRSPVKLPGNLVRIPEVSFTNWDRIPGRVVPDEPVPDLAPDLAVEVLSEGNTRAEMERKLKEYFLSDVQLVWFIDPRKRTVQVYTSPGDAEELGEGDALDGGDVLPGFAVPVASLFQQLAPAARPKSPRPGGGKTPRKRR